MLNYTDRSTIYYLKQKGWTNTQIAAFVGHHRDTIARVLREPLDREAVPRVRASAVAAYDARISGWLDQRLPVRRMLELAQEDPAHPYTGSAAAFYTYIQPLRAARRALPGDVAVRFEGLPGELLQIDWGEERQFPFTRADLVGQTRYFFAARLKYSRWMFVRFTADMREETLLRCLVACFLVCYAEMPSGVVACVEAGRYAPRVDVIRARGDDVLLSDRPSGGPAHRSAHRAAPVGRREGSRTRAVAAPTSCAAAPAAAAAPRALGAARPDAADDEAAQLDRDDGPTLGSGPGPGHAGNGAAVASRSGAPEMDLPQAQARRSPPYQSHDRSADRPLGA